MSRKALIISAIVIGALVFMAAGLTIGAGVIYFLLENPSPVFAAQEGKPDPNAGLIVISVDLGSQSERAGIVRGDILLEIENDEVNSFTDVVEVLTDFQEGDEIRLTVLHGDEVRQFKVTMETDYYPGALGFQLCCGSDESLDFAEFITADQKAMILEVIPDSPAEEAGLKEGDVILSINGTSIGPEGSLADLIAEFEVGDEVLLEVRGLETREIREVVVILGEHPDKEGVPFLGVRFMPFIHSGGLLGDDLMPIPKDKGFEFEFEMPPFRHHFEFPFLDHDRFDFPFLPYNKDFMPYYFESQGLSGILVQEVLEDSPAAEAGIQPGDLITAVDGDSFPNPGSFQGLMAGQKPGERVTLTVERQDEQTEIEVILGENPDRPGVGYLGVLIGGFILFGDEHLEQFPDDLNHYFHFDGFPIYPQPAVPEPEMENQST